MCRFTYLITFNISIISHIHVCMILTYIHVFSFNYPHIDCTSGPDTVCTHSYRLWFPYRISMGTAGGIWNKSQPIIGCRLQTHIFILLSLSHIIVAVLHHSCLIFPSCRSGSADDTDAKHNLRLSTVVQGSGMWKETQEIPNRIKPVYHLSIFVPVVILERNFSSEWKK